MGARGFGFQTVLGTPQPVFGTTLSAALVSPTPDPHTGKLDTRSQRSQAVLSVANPYIFRKGDPVIIGPGSVFQQGNTTQVDVGQVSAVNYAGGQITVVGLMTGHAAGEFVVLSMQAAIVTLIASASLLNLGEDFTVGPTSKTLIAQINPSGSYGIGISAPGNVFGTAHYWVLGTAADTFLPSITTI